MYQYLIGLGGGFCHFVGGNTFLLESDLVGVEYDPLRLNFELSVGWDQLWNHVRSLG